MVNQGVFNQLLMQLQDSDGNASESQAQFSLEYLSYYGYLNGKRLEDITLGDIVIATQAFQEVAGIEPDGLLAGRTARVMMAPRCGVPDVSPLRVQMGAEFNEFLEAKWRKRSLLYFWEDYVPGIPRDVQEDIEMTSWRSWMNVADIKIDQTRDRAKADILVGIGRGARNQFDGPGGTLAWAYLPPGNDSQLYKKYDSDEMWVKELLNQTAREIRMENVACHEDGHLLGLDHSKANGALMAPFYSPTLWLPQAKDDISRMQGLYGAPKPTTPAPPTNPPTVPPAGKMIIEVTGSILIPGYRITKIA